MTKVLTLARTEKHLTKIGNNNKRYGHRYRYRHNMLVFFIFPIYKNTIKIWSNPVIHIVTMSPIFNIVS